MMKMWMKWRSLPFVTVAVLAGVLMLASPARAVTYGGEYMTSWSGCSCSGSSLSYTDNQINMFDSEMTSLGHTKSFKYGNSSVWASDVTEDRDFGGQDRLYGDAVRMYVFSGHGGAGTDSSGDQTFHAPFCTGGSVSSCSAQSVNMRMGEPAGSYYATPYPGSAAYMMWLTCYSVHTAPHEQWGQTMQVGTDYIMGYRGTSADSEFTDEVPSDWASHAMRSSSPDTFKEAWFWAIEDWWVDDTGAVVANGNDSADAVYRRDSYRRTWAATHSDAHYYYAWSWHEG